MFIINRVLKDFPLERNLVFSFAILQKKFVFCKTNYLIIGPHISECLVFPACNNTAVNFAVFTAA